MRSNDMNIAVNIWWRHGVEVNFSHCDAWPGRTIKDLTFIGFGALHEAQEKLIRYDQYLLCCLDLVIVRYKDLCYCL